MTYTPVEYAENLRIGTIDFISPNKVNVLLDIDAPDSVALNAGGVRPFPRVNGYLLMPVDDCYLVGQIEWMTIEQSAFPKRRGMKDFGLIDLPYPLRKMSLNPIGILRKQSGQAEGYLFRRGVDALPSVSTPVLLPTEKQLRSIVETGEYRHVRIGVSPLAANAEVRVDPDRLFGRHLAVLGNTGSGKSCSIAGLIRWSLNAAKAKRQDKNNPNPNARFIVLDPNGEYARAFTDANDDVKARIFKVNSEARESAMKISLWFLNSAEWSSFTQASAKTQRPTLIQALRNVRSGHLNEPENKSHVIRKFLRTLVSILEIEMNKGTPWKPFPHPKSFYEKLEKWRQTLENDLPGVTGSENKKLNAFIEQLQKHHKERSDQHPHYDFMREDIEKLISLCSDAHAAFGGSREDTDQLDADTPKPFTSESFLRSIETTAEMLNVSEHTETLLIRIRSLLRDNVIKQIICDATDATDETLEKWLTDYIGSNDPKKGQLVILDLSLVPTEVVHVITAVVARMIFEALQRYRKLNDVVLPTVLVMEEAHTFVKRYKDDVDNHDAASICCQVFERIAREGRKFGLGLVLSSQRPSELSPTVLSQCNTFLLHQISNDRDQELVHRLVPDNLRGLLRELPSLPSRHAILLGWASELPVLVEMNELPKSQQPHSDDPDFWNVWTGQTDRKVDWKQVSDDWQGIVNQPTDKN